MKIAVISDLHLGPGDRTDRFGHEDGAFLRFLRHLEGDFERIVLLGDIWETMTTRRLLRPYEGLASARAAHPEIARRFQGAQYSYVHGNHDLVAGNVGHAPEELVFEADGTRLLFTHGHQYDRLRRHAPRCVDAGVWVGGWLLRMRLGWLYRIADAIDHARGGALVDAARCTFQRWAVGLARSRAADIVVTGHTHVPGVHEHGPRLFMNSGSCAGGLYSFLAIDTRRGAYAVHSSW